MKYFNNPRKPVIPMVVLLVLTLCSVHRVFAQPANDACSSASTLTSGTTCTTTAGTLRNSGVNATATAGISAFCGNTSSVDVWYKFVAQSTLPSIQLSSMQPGMAVNPRLQLFNTNSCTIATINANSNNCVSGSNVTSLNLTPSTALTIGTTYLIRVFTTSTPVAPSSDWSFNICVVDPSTPPSNDLCSAATTLISGTNCVNTAGTLAGATNAAVPNTCAASSGTRLDVWYSFVANSTNPTISLSSAPANPRVELFSGTCAGGITSVACSNTSGVLAATGLTVGTTYLIRVYSNTDASGTFNICVTDPAPANDLCSGATTLTSGTSCSNTSGNFYAATTSATPTITGSCAGAVTSDVWYKFVAPNANPVITLSSVGSSVTSSGIELLSGDCTSAFSLGCGTTSIAASGLIAGTTYYIRAYYTGAVLTTSTNAGFNLCVTYTAPSAPPNDECAGAINLPVNGSCSNTIGTVNSATASSGIPVGCAPTPIAYDVWYKFTAVNTGVSTTITTSSFGSGFAATQGIQLFSGTCGSLTSMACGTTSINTTALTAGTTYYIRVFTNTGPAPTAFGDFKICISTTSLPPRIGNSYVNLTRNTSGGVVQPGDVLEIRMTILLSSGTIYSTRYLDNVPAKTSMLASATDSIRVITNEGLTYKRYTPNPGVNDDAATYIAAPGAGAYNIRLNLGHGSGNWPSAPANNTATDITGAGNLPSTANPRGGGGLMFATSFRVTVTGSVGDTITLNGGQFIYKASAGGADVVLPGTPYKILITNPLTLCSNAIGVNNASEYGGTFGSGSTLNRTADLSFPIAGYSFVAASSTQAIGDGQYAIIDNTSPISGTNTNAYRKPTCPTGVAPSLLCANRMFGGYWYIKGDHSGTSNSTGNAPAASNSTGGYMLAVNADYVASEAYRQTLTGLCPNTYYEFSAWLQNICPLCGIDSTGAQFAGTATAPANGYPGVYPNLTFNLDGLDRYSTGQIDTIGWVKKGFVFLTGPTQTTATLSIRNNAQGGGGNDWVLDDISIATCFPSMSYSPTATPSVCSGNTIQIGDTVRSQFSNYTYYVWQRSQDGGSTWIDLTTPQTASPGLVGSQYQYITSYNVPPIYTTPADSGDIYRVYTATTLPNITNPNCVANDGSAPISLSVLNCGIALKTDLLSFGGKLVNSYGALSWTTSKESGQFHFELERSDDNITYTRIYSVANNNDGGTKNYYSFTDPQIITGKKWYRLAMVNEQNARKYSNIIQLNVNPTDFEIDNIVNPFKEKLSFNITIKKSEKIDVQLMDLQGKIVKSVSYFIYSGTNNLQLLNTDHLAPGIYTLRISNSERVINKKVVKNN